MTSLANEKITQFITDFSIGALSSIISKTVASPLEVIKLQMQNQDELLKQNIISKPYTSILNCLIRLIKEGGIQNLYRGNLINILFYFPTQSVNFALKPHFKTLLSKNKKIKENKLLFNILSGALAGMTSMLIFHPFDFAHTKISTDKKNKLLNKKPKYKNLKDVYKQEYKKGGLKGIYRGIPMSCTTMFIYRGLYFGLYDTFKNYAKNSFSKSLIGWGSTIAAGAAAYPFDTVRRRMMMSNGENDAYKNSFLCFKYILYKEGWKSFYKGHSANVLRSLAGAGVLVLFDKFKEIIKK
jgi:solute carrier family 25 (adenine nucleotide translocator) protein 4/5/6/31